MGWTWCRASNYYPNGNIDRKAECDAYFTEGLNEGQYEILKSTMVGGVYYAAVKKLKLYCGENADGKSQFTDLPPDKQKVFGAIFATATFKRDYLNFGYKDMDETMVPGECDCPKSIIALLTPTDNEYALLWRKRCLDKTGFRTVKISGEYELLINDRPVKLKGINHHDSNSKNDWYMTKEDYIKDPRLMKKLNINCIRTSHYPPSPVMLDLCDEMGFYVILENDLETHGFLRRYPNVSYGYDSLNKDWPCSNEMWADECLERMVRTYNRDKNHSSVIMWSIGNECGHGKNHIKMVEYLKSTDNSRLIHYEPASSKGFFEYSDVYSRMYSPISDP